MKCVQYVHSNGKRDPIIRIDDAFAHTLVTSPYQEGQYQYVPKSEWKAQVRGNNA